MFKEELSDNILLDKFVLLREKCCIFRFFFGGIIIWGLDLGCLILRISLMLSLVVRNRFSNGGFLLWFDVRGLLWMISLISIG